MTKYAVFGGTTEGRIIAEFLYENGKDVKLFVATELGEDIARENGTLNKIHHGRLDETAMKDEFIRERYDLVIDSTHPYAVEVTKNIKSACKDLPLRYIRLVREEESFKDAVYIEKMEDLKDFKFDGNILFTTGSKETGKLDIPKDKSFFIRVLPTEVSVSSALAQGFLKENIITGRGPFSKEDNIKLIKDKNIRYLITKDSGKTGGLEEKVEACRDCGIEAVIIKRPKEEGLTLEEIEELIRRGQI